MAERWLVLLLWLLGGLMGSTLIWRRVTDETQLVRIPYKFKRIFV